MRIVAFFSRRSDPRWGRLSEIPAPPLRTPYIAPCSWDINRRVAYEKTRYLPGSTESEVRRTNYDGLGHYHQMDTFGNFGRGDRRIEFTDYNPSGAPPGIADRWLLNLFEETTQTEGARKEKQTYCFDARGFLTRTHTYHSHGGTSGNDVVVEHLRDGAGHVKRARFFGGDENRRLF